MRLFILASFACLAACGSGDTGEMTNASAGDVAGWNPYNISWQFDVSDSTKHLHVHTQHL
jgi:hypothetical protein